MSKVLHDNHQNFNAEIYDFIFTKLTNTSGQLTVKITTEYHSASLPMPPRDLPALEIDCSTAWTPQPQRYDADNQLLYRNMTNLIISFIQKSFKQRPNRSDISEGIYKLCGEISTKIQSPNILDWIFGCEIDSTLKETLPASSFEVDPSRKNTAGGPARKVVSQIVDGVKVIPG
jgi:hypothetical protein